jgi:hypothetical protein
LLALLGFIWGATNLPKFSSRDAIIWGNRATIEWGVGKTHILL